jgi:hypothetical protein
VERKEKSGMGLIINYNGVKFIAKVGMDLINFFNSNRYSPDYGITRNQD